MRKADDPRYFAGAAEFGAWLAAHGEAETELIVGFHKVGSGRPSMSWPESVDEALCAGWIDGVRTRIDDARYKIRFTPRKPGSIWSRINVDRARALIEAGRMRPAGLRAFERRIERKTAIYSYERDGIAALPPVALERFESDATAWAFFEATPPSYRKVMLHWVQTAKLEATRERRLARLIAACAEGRRLLP